MGWAGSFASFPITFSGSLPTPVDEHGPHQRAPGTEKLRVQGTTGTPRGRLSGYPPVGICCLAQFGSTVRNTHLGIVDLFSHSTQLARRAGCVDALWSGLHFLRFSASLLYVVPSCSSLATGESNDAPKCLSICPGSGQKNSYMPVTFL